MFGFGKKSKDKDESKDKSRPDEPAQQAPKESLFDRLKSGLQKTRSNFGEGLASLVAGKKTIDTDLLEDLENLLLVADVGIDATTAIIDDLTASLKRNQLKDPESLYQALEDKLESLLAPCEQPLEITSEKGKPFVILMVGVNGVGKTTTIGKLARKFQDENKSVMLAAGDTFRAAAVEQLQAWGERNNVPVIAQQTGADSASVVYDA